MDFEFLNIDTEAALKMETERRSRKQTLRSGNSSRELQRITARLAYKNFVYFYQEEKI